MLQLVLPGVDWRTSDSGSVSKTLIDMLQSLQKMKSDILSGESVDTLSEDIQKNLLEIDFSKVRVSMDRAEDGSIILNLD